jgi:AraC-like DNA-binding protein
MVGIKRMAICGDMNLLGSPPHMSLTSISGLTPLTAAIEQAQPLHSIIHLLETILDEGPPCGVVMNRESHGPLPKAGPDSFETIAASFSCIPWRRFLFVLNGSYRLVSDPRDRDKDHVIKAGQFYWIRPGERSLVRNDNERSVLSVIFDDSYTRFLWYHHKKERAPGIIKEPHIALHYHTHSAPSTELRQALSLLDASADSVTDPGCHHDVALPTSHALLAWCLHELHLETERSALDTPEQGRRSFEEIRAYIADHLHVNLARSQVSKTFSISEDHLTRLFRMYAQTGFVEFVRSQRLHLAERLLATTRLSVKEVGAACGFNLSAYFIKRFREEYGTTPAQWRKSRVDHSSSAIVSR